MDQQRKESSMTRWRHALGLQAALAIAAAWLMASPAQSRAGEYHVYSCRVPYGAQKGEAAPVEFVEEAAEAPGEWSVFAKGDASYGDRCESGTGALEAALSGGVSHAETDQATWEFTAPVDEKINKVSLWRSGDADGGLGYLFWLATPTNPSVHEVFANESEFDGCAYSGGCPTPNGLGTAFEPLSEKNYVVAPAKNLGGANLYINASCSSTPCPASEGDRQGFATIVYVYATDIVLEDPTAPTFKEVEGELATASTLSGEVSMSFEAKDTGSGVYQAIVKVDGKTVQDATIDEDGGRCKAVESPDALPAFLYAQPCPSSAQAHVSLDTTGLTNGSHQIVVEVTDASGNATPVLERTVTVSNGTAGTGGSGEGAGETGSGETGSGETGTGEGAGKTGTGEGPGKTGTGEGPGKTGTEGSGGGTTGGSGNGSTGGSDGSGSGSSGAGGDPSLLSSLPGDPATTPNGTPASNTAALSAHWLGAQGARTAADGTQLNARFNAPARIAGRLTTASGAPIVSATITLTAHPSYGGARTRALGHARTDSEGRFTVSLPHSSPSEQVALAYSPTLGGTPVITASLRLSVHAALTLRVGPRTVSVGHTVRFQGRVLGGPIPPGGKQVVLEARSAGSRWLQFLVLRTNRHGRFRGAHRFRLPGPATYSFRAVCSHEADYPYTEGVSRTVRVREG